MKMQSSVLHAVRLLVSGHPGLHALDLSQRKSPLQLRLDETALLAEALGKTRYLTCLSLAENGLGPEAARLLAEAMRPTSGANGMACCLVSYLDLSGNMIGDQGAGMMAGVLKAQRAMQQQHFQQQQQHQQQQLQVRTGLGLRSLLMSHNGIGMQV